MSNKMKGIDVKQTVTDVKARVLTGHDVAITMHIDINTVDGHEHMLLGTRSATALVRMLVETLKHMKEVDSK